MNHQLFSIFCQYMVLFFNLCHLYPEKYLNSEVSQDFLCHPCWSIFRKYMLFIYEIGWSSHNMGGEDPLWRMRYYVKWPLFDQKILFFNFSQKMHDLFIFTFVNLTKKLYLQQVFVLLQARFVLVQKSECCSFNFSWSIVHPHWFIIDT